MLWLVVDKNVCVSCKIEFPVVGSNHPGLTHSLCLSSSTFLSLFFPTDGSLVLTVLSTDEALGEVTCRIENNASIGERKNMNLPGVVVDLPTLTEKDIDDIVNWGIPNDVDFIAASFVRKASDIHTIRQVLGDKGSGIKIIAKLENLEGLENYDAILEATDGIMVARGDLGMEVRRDKGHTK